MLTAIRSKASSWIIKILFALLVLSFAIWGINDIFRAPGRQATAIEVGDTSISVSALHDAYQRQLQQLQQQFGGQFTAEQAEQLGLMDNVVRGLVNDALQQIETQRLGLVVPDDLVRARIQAEPAFQDAQGRFDRNIYLNVLRRSQMSEAQYVAYLRSQIAEEQLYAALLGGTTPPKAMVDAIHGYRAETRVAKTVVVPPDAVPAIPDPAPDVLQAYYDENQNAFMAPEYRSLTLVILSPEEVASGIEVSEDRLREEYKAQKADLTIPEKRQIRQFILSDPADADTAAERLKTEPFDAVARDLGGGDPIDLGTVTRDSLPPALAEAAFAPTAPGIVGPVESALGLHMLSIEAIEPEHVPNFEDVRDELRQKVALAQAEAEIVQVANDLDDALAAGASLVEAAEQLNLQVQQIEAVDANGKAPDGSDVAPISASNVLKAMAFATEEGETTNLTELDEGGYAIMHIDGVIPAAPRPLDEIRSEVVAAWIKDEQDKALAAKAEAAAERIRSGETIEAIAAELGAQVKTSAPFTRDDGDPAASVDRRLASTLFALESGEVATAAVRDGHVIAQLVEIKAPEPAAGEEAEALQAELRRGLASDVRAQYVRALQREIPVSVDQAAIDTLRQ